MQSALIILSLIPSFSFCFHRIQAFELDERIPSEKKPFNPMINAGAIVTASLLKPELQPSEVALHHHHLISLVTDLMLHLVEIRLRAKRVEEACGQRRWKSYHDWCVFFFTKIAILCLFLWSGLLTIATICGFTV